MSNSYRVITETGEILVYATLLYSDFKLATWLQTLNNTILCPNFSKEDMVTKSDWGVQVDSPER